MDKKSSNRNIKVTVERTRKRANNEPFRITKDMDKNNFEICNGALLRKNRLDTVYTIDSKGNITGIRGINPKNLQIGDNIYNLE